MKRFLTFLFILTSISSSVGIYHSTLASSIFWQNKVDPILLQSTPEDEIEFIVFLKEQADLSGARLLPTKREKGEFVYEQLTKIANRTQASILASLDLEASRSTITYRSYWVANMIWVRGKLDLVRQMAQRSDVAHIYANPQVKLDFPSLSPNQREVSPKTLAPGTVEWNIQRVKAPEVWALGYTGQGAVIGGQDTGYQWDHEALKNSYRGWDGTTANHNYNWHDAIHSGVGTYCKENWPEPCDYHGHGTHTMGIIVGDDGSDNQIGMAPGAQWIGCRNMNNQGMGTPITYSECYQWFMAPTDLNDKHPRPDLAPEAINNSWKCTVDEGCTDINMLKTVVENVRAAGIVTVQSAGNEGPECGTVKYPAAIYDASFSVGATDPLNSIYNQSSRGPVTVDGSNRLKPEVTAPGDAIRSSVPPSYYYGVKYALMTGTSMAAPHVVGLIALLLSAQPGLAGKVDQIESIIEQSAALPKISAQLCGGISGSERPNNTYGWGLINALTTIQIAPHSFEIQKSVSDYLYDPGQIITYTLAITHVHPFTPTFNVILTDVIPADVEFITATLPHTKTGDLLQWDFSSMGPGDLYLANLVIQIPLLAPGSVVNQDYGVRSNEISTTLGLPIEILLGKNLFLPLISKRP